MLTFILSTSDEDSSDSDSLSEESDRESLLEELLVSELESIKTLLILPFFLDLLFFFRGHLRELCPVLLHFEQWCCDFVAFLIALATCNFNCFCVRLASSSSESTLSFFKTFLPFFLGKKEENLSTTPLVIVSIKDCKVDGPAKALRRSVALSI